MSKRLFVSVDLDGFADEVRGVQRRFEGAGGLNLTDPEQAHLTLKFLGDTGTDRVSELVAELERAVEDSGVDPFSAEFGGLGVFPTMDYISVVWLGVRDGTEESTRLHEAIEKRAVTMGFNPEDHDFTPHVTLARMDHAGGKERVQQVVRNEDPTVGTMQVEAVRLTESTLTQDGPEYTTVASVPL